jgi:hypothetical protein
MAFWVGDKLVEVFLRNGYKHWMLIHIEVQAQRDATLARRIFDYNYRIFTQYAQPVASLAVLADTDPNWHPRVFHSEVLGTETKFSFATVKLMDYAARSDELLASHNPFAWITLAHLRTQQARHDPDQLYAAKWQLTRLLFEHGWHKQRIIVLFKVINWMMALPKSYQRRYWRAVLKLEKEHSMEWISPLEQSFMDKGIKKGLAQGVRQGVRQGLELGLQQGREQGREEGRKEGALALLERQLIRRFGPLPKTAQNKLAKASRAQLEAWSDVLDEATSLKQVFR